MGRCHMQSTAMIWEMTRENPLLVWSSVNRHWKGGEADVCFIYLIFDSNDFQTFYESIDIPKQCLQKQPNTRSNESRTYCKPNEMRKFYWPETIPFQILGALIKLPECRITMNYQYAPTTIFFFCNPLALSIVYQYFCSCSLQGFAGAATPREGRWLLRHEGSSWEMDVICFGRVGLWTIHQRKMVPTRHRVIVVDMFWGVFSGRTKMTGVLISIINNYTYCELPSIAFPVINSYEIGVMHGIMPGVLSFPSVTKRAVLHRELKGP